MKIKFCFLILLTIISKIAFSQNNNYSDIAENKKKSVVTIYSYNNGKISGVGTGFFLNDQSNIVTNYHVIKDVDSAYIETYDKKQYKIGNIVSFSAERDLIIALVKCDQVYPCLNIGSNVNKITDEIIVIGAPQGFDQTVSVGRISAFRNVYPYGSVIQLNVLASTGSSGSPVLNMQGDVIGVITYYHKDEKGEVFQFASSIENLSLLNKKNRFTIVQLNNYLSSYHSAEIYYYSGVRCFKERDYDSSIYYFSRSLASDANYSNSRFFLASSYDLIDNSLLAIKNYKKYLETPEIDTAYYPRIMNRIGSLTLEMNMFDECRKYLEIVDLSKYDTSELATFYGNKYYYFIKINDIDSALVYSKKAVDLKKAGYSHMYNYARALYEKGKIRESIPVYLAALDSCVDSNVKSTIDSYLGNSYSILGDNNKAISYYERIIAAMPENEDIIYRLILEYNKAGKIEKAKENAIKLKLINQKLGQYILTKLKQ